MTSPPPAPAPSALRYLGPAGILLAGVSLLLTLVPWASMWCVRVGNGPERCPIRELFHVSGVWSGPSAWFLWALALSVVGLVAMPALGRRARLRWRVSGGVLCGLAAVVALLSLLVSAVFSIGLNL